MSVADAMRQAHDELDTDAANAVREACAKRVLKILHERLGVRASDPRAALDVTASLTNDFKVDSLDMLELTLDIEGEFDVHISDEDAERIDTVAAIVDWIVEGRAS